MCLNTLPPEDLSNFKSMTKIAELRQLKSSEPEIPMGMVEAVKEFFEHWDITCVDDAMWTAAVNMVTVGGQITGNEMSDSMAILHDLDKLLATLSREYFGTSEPRNS